MRWRRVVRFCIKKVRFLLYAVSNPAAVRAVIHFNAILFLPTRRKYEHTASEASRCSLERTRTHRLVGHCEIHFQAAF